MAIRTKDRRIKQGKDQEILAGIEQNLQQPGTTIPLAGTTFTPATLAAFFQDRIDAANAVVTTKAAWMGAIQTYRDLDARAAVIIRDFRNYVIAVYGADSENVKQFGFSPPKKPQMTQEQKDAAVRKRAATRRARNTMGKRQKAKIAGETAPVATPPAPKPAG
jgi:hypothetical protein